MCAYVHICVHDCREQSLVLGVILNYSLLCFSETETETAAHCTWSLLIQLGGLASMSQRATVSTSQG